MNTEKTKDKSNWTEYIFPIVVIVVIVIVGVRLGMGCHNRSVMLQPFEGHLDEYLNISELKEWDGDPYIVGKVIPIDIEDREIDRMYFDLSEELRATEPERVGTVVWLKWKKHVVARYTDGAAAYQYTCDVTIIDKSNAMIVFSGVFEGGDPPGTKTGSGPRSGSMPRLSIVEYVKTLPQK